MKKLFLIPILASSLFAIEFDGSILSNEQSSLFDAQLQKSIKEKDFNQLSWISPVNISLSRSWSKNYATGKYAKQDVLNIGIDQPIFRFGGIYYGIKLSRAKYNLSALQIAKKKRELTATAIELLFKIRQTKLTIAKLKLLMKNADIEIKSVQELFSAGLSDSVALDRAMAKKTQSEINLLEAKSNLEQLKSAFAKISSKNPDRLKLPKFHMLSKEEFLSRSYDIKLANANVAVADEGVSVTKAKYYPSIVAGAHYSKILSKTAPNVPKKRLSYSLSVSMPLSVNMGNDIEIAKYNRLIASLNAKISAKNAKVDYNLISKKLSIYDKKIAFANKEASLYRKLLKSTKNLYRAGQKSIADVNLLKNSLQIKRIDAKIYQLQKQVELLGLYR